jgi:hypothetical protein
MCDDPFPALVGVGETAATYDAFESMPLAIALETVYQIVDE